MNYYEILQVDRKASKEVIDKAFKVLAKKYHPDGQPEDKKEWAEQHFKELNNAYEVLSDNEKRSEYDNSLEEELEANAVNLQLMQDMKEFEQELIEKNKYLSNLVNELQTKLQLYEKAPHYTGYRNYIPPQQQYVNYKREPQSRPVKKEKHHTLKNFVAFLITVFIFIIVILALWYIPFTHNLIVKNSVIKSIIELFNLTF